MREKKAKEAQMTTICRIRVIDNIIPNLKYVVEDGFVTVSAPLGSSIIDSADLCQYLRCRKHVSIGKRGNTLKYCDEHAQYLRDRAKQNYEKHKLKNESGICGMKGCPNPRAQNKRQPGKLGRCCAEHAAKINRGAKIRYNVRKLEDK